MRPNLSFIHSRWPSFCARGSSDCLLADYSRRPFYNSKSSKPNESASPFGEAQFQALQRWHHALALAKTSYHIQAQRFRWAWRPRRKNSGFRQVHRGRLSDNDKVLHGFVLPGSNQLSRTRRPTRSVKITLIYTASATCSNHTPVATLFLCDRISPYWHQFKDRKNQEVHNWASQLEHLQSIGFEADRVPEKPDLIWFIGGGLKPSVKALIE